MATNIFKVIADGMRRAAREPAKHLPDLPGRRATNLDADLEQLDTRSQQIDTAQELGAWNTETGDWGQALSTVATTAFARGPEEERAAKNELLARYVQLTYPRLGAFGNVTGLITWRPDPTLGRSQSRIDWRRAHKLMTVPDEVVTEQTWEELLDSNGNGDSIAAVLAALMIAAPQTLRALQNGTLRVSGPPLPPVRSNPAGIWANFRLLTKDWFGFTIPFGNPTLDKEHRMPRGITDWISDLVPDRSITLAIRAARRRIPLLPNKVTDFEAWLAFAADQDRWEYDVSDNWQLTMEPGITVGVGYDGETQSWDVALRPFSTEPPYLPAAPEDPITLSLRPKGPEDSITWGLTDNFEIRLYPPTPWLKLRRVTPRYEVGLTFRAANMRLLLPSVFASLHGLLPGGIDSGLQFDSGLDISYAQGMGIRLNRSGGLIRRSTSEPSPTPISPFFSPGPLFPAREAEKSTSSVVQTPDELGVIWQVNWRWGDGSRYIQVSRIGMVAEFKPSEEHLEWRLKLRLALSGQLGPLAWSVDGDAIGLGVWEPSLEYFPQAVLRLAIALGPVSGEGVLHIINGPLPKYAGAMNLRIGSYEVNAYGIYEEVDEDTTSFIAVMNLILDSGLPLGLGIKLEQGIGGIVAINRRLELDALKQRLGRGGLANVFFPADPIASAPTLLGDLDTLFPKQDNVHVVGPTAHFVWADIIEFDVVLLIEVVGTRFDLPGPLGSVPSLGLNKIVVLGTGHTEISVGNATLLYLHYEVSGLIDARQKVAEFDAILVRSSILDMLQISGSVAFRMSWGYHPYLMLAIGGFHPDFNPEPARFPTLPRILAAFQQITSAYELQASFQLYLAFTSNTIQLGAQLEVNVKLGSLQAHGWIGFDALIQFSPFFFSFSYAVGFRVQYRSFTLTGVQVSGRISGPGPVTISAELCIEILGFDVCWDETFTLGELARQTLRTVNDLLDELEEELTRVGNLVGLGGEDREVEASGSQTEQGRPVGSPTGGLTWTQRRVPLDTLVERFEGGPLTHPQAVEVRSPQGNGRSAREFFSPGSFAELSDSEALNRASFERLPSGLELGFDMEHAEPLGHQLRIQQYVLPRREATETEVEATTVPTMVAEGMRGRIAPVSDFKRSAAAIRVNDEAWAIRAKNGDVLSTGLSQTEAHQRARWEHAAALPANDTIMWEVA